MYEATVEVDTPDGTMPIYEARPDGAEPRRGVDVERLRAELDRVPVEHEVVRYGGAGHGFHCDERPEYEPGAAKDAWARTLEWLERHLAA
jgi:dienelactone hydrolase